MLKHKCWHDTEAIVVGFEEMEHNDNEAFKGELGQTKRSTDAAGMVAAGVMGALIVLHPKYGQFKIGTGFDADLRRHIWLNKSEHIGLLAKFKCQLEGAKDKPRFPVFLGFRHEEDMS